MGREFTELARAQIKDKRFAVISQNNVNNTFTIAQQVVVVDGKEVVKVFMKGSLHVDSLQAIYNLRDALNEAIHKMEKKS